MVRSHDDVDVEQVHATYGRTVALNGVTFNLGPGVTGLLGPNGAGKSTLLRILATAQAPSQGNVVGFGIDWAQASTLKRVRHTLGYLPQDPGFYPHFRVTSFVEHFALLKEIGDRGERRQEVERVLADVGLTERSRSRIRSLSGGMRQRLALACAIVGDPSLLILDEPTVGLDPEQRVRFRELIADQGQRGKVVILSTHLTDDITALCRRVLVLAQGTLRFDGPPDALADAARGRVWISGQRAPEAVAGWGLADGSYRNIGTPPPGANLAAATIDDGYLVAAGALENRS